MRFGLEHQGQIGDTERSLTPEELDELTDIMMDALLEISEIQDPDVTASLSSGVVTFTFAVEADSVSRALAISERAIQAAIRAAGLTEADTDRVGNGEVEIDSEGWAGQDWHIRHSDSRLVDA